MNWAIIGVPIIIIVVLPATYLGLPCAVAALFAAEHPVVSKLRKLLPLLVIAAYGWIVSVSFWLGLLDNKPGVPPDYWWAYLVLKIYTVPFIVAITTVRLTANEPSVGI